jgi:hypothetical protein
MFPQNTQRAQSKLLRPTTYLFLPTSLIIRATSVNKQLVDVNHLVDTSHCRQFVIDFINAYELLHCIDAAVYFRLTLALQNIDLCPFRERPKDRNKEK